MWDSKLPFCLIIFSLFIGCFLIEKTNGQPIPVQGWDLDEEVQWFENNKYKLIQDLYGVSKLFPERRYMPRLIEIYKILVVSRARILANMAGSFHDPGCKNAIWSAPTLTDMNETISINTTELNITCAGGNCTDYLIENSTAIEIDPGIYSITVGECFKLAEDLYFKGLNLFSKFELSETWEIDINAINEIFFLLSKKRGWDPTISQSDEQKRYAIFKEIEDNFVCALLYYEQIFSSIELLLEQYIATNDPSFSLSTYNPYEQVDPYTIYYTSENTYQTSYNIGDQGVNKKKRWVDSTIPGSLNCTTRGLIPIWANINCYSVKLLDSRAMLRMMFEDSREPWEKCVSNCSRKIYYQQDYDMNDFVAKFDYIHVYLSCSASEDKKLYWTMSNLLPEAKGSQKLSELILSLDYLSGNFDETLCDGSNRGHMNQNARSLLSKGKCTGGEISGGNWNEYARATLFEFSEIIDEPIDYNATHQHHYYYHHQHGYIFPNNSNSTEHDSNVLYNFQDDFGNSIDHIHWLKRKTVDVLEDINFSSVSWAYCIKPGYCSEEITTNCGEKCDKIKKSGYKKFLGLGVDDFFHPKYNHTLSPPYNVFMNAEYIEPIKKFTTFVSAPGLCGSDDTEMTTPMYVLRNYESTTSECCLSNNCKDVVLNDFYGTIGDNVLNTKNHLPSALVTGASRKWGYPLEGHSLFTFLDISQTSPLDDKGYLRMYDENPPRQTGNVMKMCHYKSSHAHSDHHRDLEGVSKKKRNNIFEKEKNLKRFPSTTNQYQYHHSHFDHHSYSSYKNSDWKLSEYVCGCDSDCVGRPIPEDIQDMLNNTHSESEFFDEGDDGPIVVVKCMQPLGFCVLRHTDSATNQLPLNPVKKACDYFDDCRYIGDNYKCDTSFIDDNGSGFAFCINIDTNEPTTRSCYLNKKTKQCDEAYYCSAGDPGCYPGFLSYLQYCDRILLLSNGEKRCQHNVLNPDIFNQINNKNLGVTNDPLNSTLTNGEYHNQCLYIKYDQ